MRGYGRGLGLRRGFRGGFDYRMGRGRGSGRGYGWFPPANYPAYPVDANDEVDMLKTQAENLKNSLDAINERIAALESIPTESS